MPQFSHPSHGKVAGFISSKTIRLTFLGLSYGLRLPRTFAATLLTLPIAPQPKHATMQSSPSIFRKLRNSPRGWMKISAKGSPFLAYPQAHQLKLRTSNALRRVNHERKRRSRVASFFPNQASVLRLITALLVEISEQSETGRIYLNMKPQNHSQN